MASQPQTDNMNPLIADAAPRLSLLIQAGPNTGKRIACRRVVTLIGSREGCKVTLPQRGISSVHVAIVNDGSHIFAADLVTRTNTLLNGLKMEHERLSDGDVLAVGPWEFRVEIEEHTPTGTDDLHPFGLDPTPHVAVLEHLDTSRILRPSRALCVIGRRNGCDIVISDKRVSRVHSLITSYFGHPVVFDLLSENHTIVNGDPVQFHILQDDDLVTIGESGFRARLIGSSVADKVSDKKSSVETTVVVTAEEHSTDLIDIRATEGVHSWQVVDHFDKAARKG